MKAVAYSVKPFEKEFLAKANQKKHDITLISNSLNLETTIYAEGKDVVIVSTDDDVSAPIVQRLAGLGIKYITTRSAGIDHIDVDQAAGNNIKLSNVPRYSPQTIAEHTLSIAFALNRPITLAEQQRKKIDFRKSELIGFNFFGKTVGLIGLESAGIAISNIFKGLGCRIIGYDVNPSLHAANIQMVGLDTLISTADIISLHLPLSPETNQIMGKKILSKMKDGVMLINTSGTALFNIPDVLEALENGKIGYLGIDLFQCERGLFFDGHLEKKVRDPLLMQLIDHPKVIIAPHQTFLTREGLQDTANQTIRNLDLWQANKCVGKACVCAKNCNQAKSNETQSSQIDVS